MKYIGIDIGGMSIKAGVVLEDGTILCKKTVETDANQEDVKIVKDIARLIDGLLKENGIEKSDIAGVGIGSPGSVYDEKGIIRYSCNINFKNTPIAKLLKEFTGIDNVKVSNDANCAALGETLFGAGKGAKNTVMLTLGTGVGTGIVVDGKLLTGNRSAGAEGGHITINLGGPVCGCGKKGHLEAYASATALMNQIEDAVKKHPESLLAVQVAKEGLSGKVVFDCKEQGDKVAENVVKRYLKYVGIGLVNYANIFYPEVLIIGGGISNQGDNIVKPLQRYVSRNVYGAEYNPKIKVACATLKNDAGIVGAACLVM
ncbi:MAG: ROK family protein [Clostridia bacterium]|nr:ROK family protein [Clostridia bacterium]